MSMLTPPGMRGKYRITGNQYPRMRRPRGHRRIVLAVVSAAAALGLLGYGSLQLMHVFGGRSGGSRAAGAARCARPAAAAARTGPLPKPAAVTVNVYNATQRSGLAKSTADELRKRGFAIGKIGNAPAPYGGQVKGSAILLGGPAAQGALKVLGTEVAAAAAKTDASRTGGSDVDLILGDGFGGLAPQQNADQALAALAHPASSAAKGCRA